MHPLTSESSGRLEGGSALLILLPPTNNQPSVRILFPSSFVIICYGFFYCERYLNTTKLPAQQFWNRTGRGYPDVSAVGHYLLIVDGGAIAALGILHSRSTSLHTY